MFCTKCGAKLDDTARFCTACGQPVGPAVNPAALPVSPESTAAPRRLRRILEGKKIAGVCQGFAEYFDMDVTLMRLIWVGLLLVPPNVGLIGYIVAWAVLPTR